MLLTKKNALVSVAAVALSACVNPINGIDDAMTVRERHPITVDAQTVTLTLDAEASSERLSDLDTARVRAFADAYVRRGHGALSLMALPTARSNDIDAVREALVAGGVANGAINETLLPAGDPSEGRIVLAYTNYVATASECEVWSGFQRSIERNLSTPNFGCATQKNLAAMIADPRDLETPAALSPADTPSRLRVLETYRNGEVSSVETDEAIETDVSQ